MLGYPKGYALNLISQKAAEALELLMIVFLEKICSITSLNQLLFQCLNLYQFLKMNQISNFLIMDMLLVKK